MGLTIEVEGGVTALLRDGPASEIGGLMGPVRLARWGAAKALDESQGAAGGVGCTSSGGR